MSASPTGVSIRVMTYDDIASEMGLKPTSARQLVRRNGWRRVPGNDGRARIEVPVEEFERDIKRGVEASADADESDPEPPFNVPLESPLEAPLVTALTGHIKRLERALADAETALSTATGERDEARAVAQAAREEVLIARGQIEVVRVQINAEKDCTALAERRTADAAADRDRWHTAATARRPWWKRLAG